MEKHKSSWSSLVGVILAVIVAPVITGLIVKYDTVIFKALGAGPWAVVAICAVLLLSVAAFVSGLLWIGRFLGTEELRKRLDNPMKFWDDEAFRVAAREEVNEAIDKRDFQERLNKAIDGCHNFTNEKIEERLKNADIPGMNSQIGARLAKLDERITGAENKQPVVDAPSREEWTVGREAMERADIKVVAFLASTVMEFGRTIALMNETLPPVFGGDSGKKLASIKKGISAIAMLLHGILATSRHAQGVVDAGWLAKLDALAGGHFDKLM